MKLRITMAGLMGILQVFSIKAKIAAINSINIFKAV